MGRMCRAKVLFAQQIAVLIAGAWLHPELHFDQTGTFGLVGLTFNQFAAWKSNQFQKNE